jgi:hypothetical protein
LSEIYYHTITTMTSLYFFRDILPYDHDHDIPLFCQRYTTKRSRPWHPFIFSEIYYQTITTMTSLYFFRDILPYAHDHDIPLFFQRYTTIRSRPCRHPFIFSEIYYHAIMTTTSLYFFRDILRNLQYEMEFTSCLWIRSCKPSSFISMRWVFCDFFLWGDWVYLMKVILEICHTH